MAYLDCEACVNFLVDEEAGRLRLNASSGIPEEEIRKLEWLDYEVTISGCAVRDGVRIVANDIFNTPDPRAELVKSFGIQAYACHPLLSQDRVLGTLSFGTRTRPRFTEDELSLMKAVADQVSSAMERMRLIDKLEKSRDELEIRVQERTAELQKASDTMRNLSAKLLNAQEQERKLIALDLHDSLAAKLAAVKFGLEQRLTQVRNGTIQGTASLEDSVLTLKQVIDETRRLMSNLRPSMIDDLGILPTINWHCREFKKIYDTIGIEKEIGIEEEEVPDELKIVIFRIIQEAMNNIGKHSKADRVRLSLQRVEDKADLEIQDNGRGFDVDEVLSGRNSGRGLGLSGMRERVELSGGCYDLIFTKGQGTTIRASWPLDKKARHMFQQRPG
jgi:signal transduction histidine kinase